VVLIDGYRDAAHVFACGSDIVDGQTREGSRDGEKVDKPQEKNPDGTGRGARARRAEGSCLIRFDYPPPTSFLLTTYKHVPSLPIPAFTHEALILAKMESRMLPPLTDHPTQHADVVWKRLAHVHHAI
jgi:hypothetical protein